MIKVLIVEDSITQREILRRIIESDSAFTVVGEAANGRDALEFVKQKRPDIVLMDVHMEPVNGIEATRRIMATSPVPIIIMSSTLQTRDIDLAVEAMRVGAVSAIEKPTGAALLHLQKIGPQLRRLLHEAADTHVRKTRPVESSVSHASSVRYQPPANRIRAVGICSSAGGPSVLVRIFRLLPRPLELPILLVQHISPGFEAGFAGWLESQTGHSARLATHHQRLSPGIWLGPRDHHLTLIAPNLVALLPRNSQDIHCPAGDPLLHSLARHLGHQAAGIVLTGMGADGAEGLRALRDVGGHTLIQNESTAMVWGMPAAAKKLGAAQYELSPEQIATAITMLPKKQSPRSP